MKITIAYLYYDLMNLYGDIGNIKALEYHLKHQGVKVTIKKLSIDDKFNFDDYDLIYIGSSTENNRNICLENILKYKEKINEVIEKEKFFLITGNALSLFGKSIDGKEALSVFPFNTITSNRNVKEIVTKNRLINNYIYGFMNNQDEIINNKNYLFDEEGILYKNFYGTHMIGPLLIRNPEFTKLFIKNLIISKYPKVKLKKFNFDLDNKAYKEFIEFKKNKIHIK